MKKRLWWSMLLASAALLVTSVTAFADRPGVGTPGPGGTAPSSIQQIPARVPSNSGGTSPIYKAWEGLNSTNYLNPIPRPETPNFADIAVGPADILTIVNYNIVRYPNPNAVNNATSLLTSAKAYNDIIRQQQPLVGTSSYNEPRRQALDRWLGPTLLGHLCPTTPRIAASCIITDATVRYDQLQGRFLVLMSVTDTGLKISGGQDELRLQAPRKASWVLFISKNAAFNLGTNPSDLFSPANIGTGNPIGGAQSANWYVYYGNDVATIGTDGFGSSQAFGGVGVGNINSIPGMGVAANAATVFNCGLVNGAIPTDGSVCYFPTSTRLGIDNDNVILVSSVVNTNFVAGAEFAGSRVRVIKKVALYNPTRPLLVAGNQFAADGQKDYFDLFAYSDYGVANPVGLPVLVDPVALPTVSPAPYTLAPPFGQRPTAAGAVQLADNPVYCEPQILRGRAAASFSNAMIGTYNGVPSGSSQSYIECIRANPANGGKFAAHIFVQPIKYNVIQPVNPASNTRPGLQFFPQIVGDGTVVETATAAACTNATMNDGFSTAAGCTFTWSGLQQALTEAFRDPGTVGQAGSIDGTYNQTGSATNPAPALMVGDARPQKLVFREGHLYDARGASTFQNAFNVDGPGLNATVAYDIIQKLQGTCATAPCSPIGTAGQAINRIFNTQWYNAAVYGAMYDVPANVSLSGTASSSPINTLPWLEKLFVATTYPALAPTDPRIGADVTKWGLDNCSGPYPGVTSAVPGVTGPWSWSGLFDIRCGQDTYDYLAYIRNPNTGLKVGTYSLTTRNNASIDPNNGSMWNAGLYAVPRDQSIPGAGQWGSYIANYDLSFPQYDPYGNAVQNYSDLPTPGCCSATNPPTDQTYIAVQVLKTVGVIAPPPGNVVPVAGAPGDVNSVVVRIEAAKYIATSLMDETAISAYLNATGGCDNSFSDVDQGCAPGGVVTNATGLLTFAKLGTDPAKTWHGGWRYAELLYRRGISVGTCPDADPLNCGVQRGFDPYGLLRRMHITAFIIRAKMNNVFPSSLNGCPALTNPICVGNQPGDNFNLFALTTPYFSDVPANSIWFSFVQKMYEMRITNGTTPPTFAIDGTIATAGTYGLNDPLTRRQVMVFLARGFFY